MTAGGNSSGQLLQLFRQGKVSTRGDLQRVTGLARSTVTFRVDSLLAAGYLVEDGVVNEVGRGRPATVLRLNDIDTTVLAADLGATHGRVAACTAGGAVLAEEVMESEIDQGPEIVLGRVRRAFDRLLDQTGRSRATLRAAAVGVPGPVAWDSGRIARPLNMPGWDDFGVADYFSNSYRVPVAVGNDAYFLGLGEQAASYPGAHLLIFVKVGTGIGAAVIVNGQVLRGRHSAEGNIGHAKIAGLDKVCGCGAVGCLAATASGRAMVRDLNQLGHTVQTSRDVVALARRGDPDAVRVITEGGRALGSVLSTAASLINPEVLVLGGDIALASEQLLGGVRETLLSQTQPLALTHLTLAVSRLGDHAGIAGAVLMARDKIFSPQAVDAALESRGRSGLVPRSAGRERAEVRRRAASGPRRWNPPLRRR